MDKKNQSKTISPNVFLYIFYAGFHARAAYPSETMAERKAGDAYMKLALSGASLTT
jgi:hypothetical protein